MALTFTPSVATTTAIINHMWDEFNESFQLAQRAQQRKQKSAQSARGHLTYTGGGYGQILTH